MKKYIQVNFVIAFSILFPTSSPYKCDSMLRAGVLQTWLTLLDWLFVLGLNVAGVDYLNESEPAVL